MNKYITKGTVTGLLACAALVATLFGKPELAALFNDPATAANILVAAGAIGAVVAGVLKGVEHKA